MIIIYKMNSLSNKCLISIFMCLDTLSLMKYRQACTTWNNLITTNIHRFHIDLSGNQKVTDDVLKQFVDAYSIDLSDCPITNNSLIHMLTVHTINLTGCWDITDKGLSYLKWAKVINLSDCYNITDEGLKYLADAEYINLSYCHNITNKGLEYIKNGKVIIS
jgi:hypothetical protein